MLRANRTDHVHAPLSIWPGKQGVGATLAVAWPLATCLACYVQAQSQTQRSFPNWNAARSTGSITVSVRDDLDAPLAVAPDVFVTAATPDGSVKVVLSRKEGEDWVFSNLEAGAQHVVTARALGFQTAEQFVNLPDVRFASANVKFFLVPSNGQSDFATPAGGAVLAPHAAREVREGVKDLEANRVDSAKIILAIALANLGERDKARKMLVGYLKQHPNNPHGQQLRAIIEKLWRRQLSSH